MILAGERAFAELSAIREPERVDTASVLPRCVAMIARRFDQVEVRTALKTLPVVRLAGGEASLERIVFNLARNATEGDGDRGATVIRFLTEVQGRDLVLTVEDNGPGFPDAMLAMPVDAPLTTKLTGSGLGLFGITQVLRASGGTLYRRNGPESGATVTITLPIDVNAPQ
jgi:C4-dicarboxylate-specific signal transduction histidine kinase